MEGRPCSSRHAKRLNMRIPDNADEEYDPENATRGYVPLPPAIVEEYDPMAPELNPKPPKCIKVEVDDEEYGQENIEDDDDDCDDEEDDDEEGSEMGPSRMQQHQNLMNSPAFSHNQSKNYGQNMYNGQMPVYNNQQSTHIPTDNSNAYSEPVIVQLDPSKIKDLYPPGAVNTDNILSQPPPVYCQLDPSKIMDLYPPAPLQIFDMSKPPPPIIKQLPYIPPTKTPTHNNFSTNSYSTKGYFASTQNVVKPVYTPKLTFTPIINNNNMTTTTNNSPRVTNGIPQPSPVLFQTTTVFKSGKVALTIIEDEPLRRPRLNSNADNDEEKTVRFKLQGIGELLNQLRNPQPPEPKPRIILNDLGHPITTIARRPLPQCHVAEVMQRIILGEQQQLEGCDLPPPPDHPTDVREIRRLIRSKMIRCKRCKNRFGERNLYERHLRDFHPDDYKLYMIEQDAEMELQRLEEMEANRIEELQTGGFIPPENEIEEGTHDIDPDGIPLPGENNGGVAPHFDQFGRLQSIKRPYKKKISPQCPFCDKRFRNEYSLRKHLTKKHEEMFEFEQCSSCFKCVENKQELLTHVCELTYVCFECTPIRNLCTDQRLLNHRRKFHRGANSGFRCNLCPLKFLTPRKLRKHKKMAHVFTKTFQCHFCEEIFISEVAVMTHERIHTGIIKFECRICDYKANRFIHMEEHCKNEHGYICAICKIKLAEWSDMKNHTLHDHGGYLTQEQHTGYIESPRVWVMFKGD